MKKYIYSAELISVLDRAVALLDTEEDKYAVGFCDGLRAVIDMATVGYNGLSIDTLEPVVRCNECKYSFGNKVKWCELSGRSRVDMDFCSRGEKRVSE